MELKYRTYWHLHFEKLDIESQTLIVGTLPTTATRMLLQMEIDDITARLGGLNTSCSDSEFKLKYDGLRKRKGALEDFLHFIVTLTDRV